MTPTIEEIEAAEKAGMYCLTFHDWLYLFRDRVREALSGYTQPTIGDLGMRAERIAELQEVRRIGAPFKNLLGDEFSVIADQLNSLPIGLHRELMNALIDAVAEGVEVQLEIVHVNKAEVLPDRSSRQGAETAAFVSTRTVYFGEGSRVRVVRLGLSIPMLQAIFDEQQPPSS